MTYSDFWDGDPKMAVAYRKAREIQREQRNEELWLQGRYIYDALCQASGLFRVSFSKRPIKAAPYTEEPYPVTQAAREAKEERERKKQLERMKAQFMEFATRVKPRTQSATEHRSVEITEENNDGKHGNRQSTN